MEKFEGVLESFEERQSTKAGKYGVLKISGKTYTSWDPIEIDLVEGMKLKGTYEQSGDFRNIKTIEVVEGFEFTQKPTPQTAESRRALIIMRESALKSATRLLNGATEIQMPGEKKSRTIKITDVTVIAEIFEKHLMRD